MILLFNLLRFVDWLLDIYTWVIIAAAVVTWVNPDPSNPIVRFLRGVTEPVFQRIRRLIPTNFGGLDIAPLLLILVIYFVQRVLMGSLFSWFKAV
ncbi:MAG: YggT family protein [Desulfarculus sp.]|nr:YggT family protein [Desulfarculus sp.]